MRRPAIPREIPADAELSSASAGAVLQHADPRRLRLHPRTLTSELTRQLTEFPIVTLLGPRQAGRPPWPAPPSPISVMYRWRHPIPQPGDRPPSRLPRGPSGVDCHRFQRPVAPLDCGNVVKADEAIRHSELRWLSGHPLAAGGGPPHGIVNRIALKAATAKTVDTVPSCRSLRTPIVTRRTGISLASRMNHFFFFLSFLFFLRARFAALSSARRRSSAAIAAFSVSTRAASSL